MRVGLYCRVSTDEQAQRFGLTSQLHELRLLAASKGHEVVAEYIDDGWSGATLDRPALARLREAVRTGAIDRVLVHDPDRFARRLVLQLVLIDEIERAGVVVEFATVSRDETPEGRLLLNVRGVISEFERVKIAERTQRGKWERARSGRVSVYPFGYAKSAEGGVRIVDDEAATVRLMFSMLATEGRSIRSIAAELRRLGLRTRRGQWTPQAVRYVLGSRYYAGTAYYGRRETAHEPDEPRPNRWRPESSWVPLAVPAIVTPAIYETAQRRLALNVAALAGRPPVRVYLLRRLLVCRCGRRMVSDPAHGRRSYRCRACGAREVPAKIIEPLVWGAVTATLRDPAAVMRKLDERQARAGVRDVEVGSEVAHLEREAERLARDEGRLLDLMLAEELSTDTIRGRLADLQRRRRGVTERLDRARQHAAQAGADEAQEANIRQACARVVRGMARLNEEGRRDLLAVLVSEVRLLDDGRVRIRGVLPTGGESTQPSRRSGQLPERAYLVELALPGGRR